MVFFCFRLDVFFTLVALSISFDDCLGDDFVVVGVAVITMMRIWRLSWNSLRDIGVIFLFQLNFVAFVVHGNNVGPSDLELFFRSDELD